MLPLWPDVGYKTCLAVTYKTPQIAAARGPTATKGPAASAAATGVETAATAPAIGEKKMLPP